MDILGTAQKAIAGLTKSKEAAMAESGPTDAPTGKTASPASPAPLRVESATRIPMTLPTLKLSVPDIPGYVLQWHIDHGGQIQRAQRAGWEFVEPSEIEVMNTGLGSDQALHGSTDLGTRVSLHGSAGENGQSERLYLMKQKQQWWDEDRKILADRNESVAAAIRGGSIGSEKDEASDRSTRYVKGASAQALPKRRDNMFTPKRS